MTAQGNASRYQVANDAELGALYREWRDGTLIQFREPLLSFVARDRERILARARGNGPDALVEATAEMIRDARVVDLASENRDQRHEMGKEVWIQGEKGNHDVQAIEMDWTHRWAGDWRRWRILEYVFLAERIAPEVIRTLGID